MKILISRKRKVRKKGNDEALYESSVRKLGWRFTARLPYRTAVNWPDLGPAKIHNFGRHFNVFSDLLYQKLLICYIQTFYIILKLNFLWVLASVLDESLVFNSWMGSPKCWKNDEIFKKYENFNFSKENLFFSGILKFLNFWKLHCFWKYLCF